MSEEFEGEKFIKGREGGDYYSGFYVDWLENQIAGIEAKLGGIASALTLADEHNKNASVQFYIRMALMAAEDALTQYEKS